MLSIDPADEDSDDEGNKSKVSTIGAAGQHTPFASETYSPLKVNPSVVPAAGNPVVVLNNIDATLNGAAAVPVDMIPKLNSLPNSHYKNSTAPNDVTVLDSEESNDASKVNNLRNATFLYVSLCLDKFG